MTEDDINRIKEMGRLLFGAIEIAKDNYQKLAARYDDALKRINDLEAELEHLRREVNR